MTSRFWSSTSPYAFGPRHGFSGGGITPPANTVLPAITGTKTTGQVLTSSTGTWSGSPTGYSYQWRSAGLAVGTNASTYTLTSADGGNTITCDVTATNAGGSTLASAPSVGTIFPVAQSAAGYLSSVVAPYACWGVQRMVSGWAGNLYQLRRSSDSATLNVACATSSDFPDYSAIKTWAGTDTLTVTTIYDQSGNGFNITAASTSVEPAFSFDYLTHHLVAPILFDWQRNDLLEVGSLTLDLITHSHFSVTQFDSAAVNERGIFEYTSEDKLTAYEGFSGTGLPWCKVAQGGGQTAFPAGSPNAKSTTMPIVSGAANASASVNLFNGTNTNAVNVKNNVWGTALTTQAMARVRVGQSEVLSTAYGKMKFFGLAIYNSTVSSTNGQTIWGSLQTAFSTPSTATRDYQVSIIGDSIPTGSANSLMLSPTTILERLATKNAEFINYGAPGETMQSAYSARVARYKSAVVTPAIVFLQYGTNDLAGGSGVITGANLYANFTTPFITFLHGLGTPYKVVAMTVMPRTDYTGTQETERQNYNALVLANSAGADYVLDIASNPALVTAAAPNYKLEVGKYIHPSDTGIFYETGAGGGTYANSYTYYEALKQVLRTAKADVTYVP